MKVKEIIKRAAIHLGRMDIAESVGSSSEYENEINELLLYYNEAEKEIAAKYFPMRTEEKISTSDGTIAYTKLSGTPEYIDRIVDSDGYEVEYIMYPSMLKTGGKGTLTLYYLVPPLDKALSDECERILGAATLALTAGILKEYYLARGMLDESAVWGRSFYEILRATCIKKEVKARMPMRRWR